MTRGVSLAAAFVAVSWIGMLGGDPPGTLHAGQSRGVNQRENAPAGNVAAGKARWNEQECAFCHGLHGQGGYGPDLAGW